MKIFEFCIGLFLRLLPCAFSSADMNRVHAGTVTVWSYKTNDTIAVATGSGYFNDYTTWLRQGDIILIAGDLDGTPDYAGCCVSSVDNAATVTVAT